MFVVNISRNSMTVHRELVQAYFIGIGDGRFAEVAKALKQEGQAMQLALQDQLSEWRFLCWLGRPSIIALRSTKITTGLDTFLLEKGGVPGVEDVAELLVYPFEHDFELGLGRSDVFCRTFEDFEPHLVSPGLAFVTLIKIDWELILNSDIWSVESAPSKSSILAAFFAALEKAVKTEKGSELLGDRCRVLVTGGVGDADIVVFGSCKDRRSLDSFLYMITQIGADSVANILFGPEVARSVPSDGIVADTTTELAIGLEPYLEALRCAAVERELNESLRSTLEIGFDGNLFGQVGLKRGATPLTQLRGRILNVTGPGWEERTVMGDCDIIIQPASPRNRDEPDAQEVTRVELRNKGLADYIWLMARLEHERSVDAAFPRLVYFQLSFSEPVGKELNLPDRADLLGFEGDLPRGVFRGDSKDDMTSSLDLNSTLEALKEVRSLGWREDLRILERMVERSITLQKSPDLSPETRNLASRFLGRIIRAVDRIGELAELRVKLLNSKPPDNELAVECERDEVGLRQALLAAGVHLDRALAHHIRGVTPLLFLPTIQARGQEHIGNEIMLSDGFASVPQAVVGSIKSEFLTRYEEEIQDREGLKRTLTELDLLAEPIIYASHATDFRHIPSFGLIQVPRWVLWYPTSSSFIVHELGHAITELARVDYVARFLLRTLTDPKWWNLRKTLHLDRFAEIHRRLLDEDSPVQRDALGDLTEVSADLVCRLFCYFRGDTKRYLFDFLDYFEVMASRLQRPHREKLVLRLLSVFIASEQIYRSFDHPQNYWKARFEDTRDRLADCVKLFSQLADQWLSIGSEVNVRHNFLAPVVRDLVHRTSSDGWASDNPIARAVDWGQFVAGISLEGVFFPGAREPSLFFGQRIWTATVAAGVRRSIRGYAHTEVVDTLTKGSVPQSKVDGAEKIPRELFWRSVQGESRPEPVPIYQRIALSLYLRDLNTPKNRLKL